MLNKMEEENISKFMSFVLRHKPTEIGIVLDQNGWILVEELILKANLSGKSPFIFSREILEYIVLNNKKQRFALSEDKTLIRANQGHTILVDLDLPFIEPPEFLYHGTAIQNIKKIMLEGLKSMQRHDVHLSFDKDIAKDVGARYGRPVVLKIKSKAMYLDGMTFQCTKNNVWLTNHVPSQYIMDN
jgi:putative RNA 2'-phosphotransferase